MDNYSIKFYQFKSKYGTYYKFNLCIFYIYLPNVCIRVYAEINRPMKWVMLIYIYFYAQSKRIKLTTNDCVCNLTISEELNANT